MTDSLPPFPRLMSNKENPAPYPTLAQTMAQGPTASPKPRLGGVGRAPRPRNRGQLYKPYSRKGSFTHKSRFRQTSLQRAKLANARKRSFGKQKVDENRQGFKIAADGPKPMYRLTPVGTVLLPAPTRDLFLPASMPLLEPVEIEGVFVPVDEDDTDDADDDADMDTGTKLVEAPKVVTSSYPTKVQYLGRVPLTLPVMLKRPMIPPVLHDTDGDCAVPIDYVLQRITPFFGTIHRLLPLFEEGDDSLRTPPQRIHTPTFNTAEGPMQRIDDMYDTLPFWIGQAIPHAGLNDHMKKVVYQWGPDACLVVRKKGVMAEEGEFYPVKKLVLTSQCAFFEKVAEQGIKLRGDSVPNPDKDKPCLAKLAAQELARRRAALKTKTSAARTTLVRAPAPQPIRVSGSRWTSLAPSSDEATPEIVVDLAESNSTAPAPPPKVKTPPKPSAPAHPLFRLATPVETYPPPKPPGVSHLSYGTRQLDLIPIYLPHPDTFPALLTALHFPRHSPIRHLIPTPPGGTASSSEEIIEYMRCLPPAKLDTIMDRIFGFYSNLVELGINNECFWGAINNAWTLAYIAKQRRVHVHPPMVEDYAGTLGPVIKWKMVIRFPEPGEKVPV